MPPRSPAPDPWSEAVRRATDATAADRPGGMDEQCWDDVAMRGIVATVLYALHLRERRPVDAIGWPAVLWQLRDDERVTELVTTVLPRAGHDLSRTAAVGDPVSECWRWLTRTWDPQAPVKSALLQPALSRTAHRSWVADAPEPRWGGMSRGIARGLPDPALEICTAWAADVVQRAITATTYGHCRHARVAVIAGAHTGRRGYVVATDWHVDDATETVRGPAGYVLDLDEVEGTFRAEPEAVTDSSDLLWPCRPARSLKDVPPPGPHDPLPRTKNSAEDLADILGRVVDPAIVPGPLQARIAAAYAHHHLELDRQARLFPLRVSWQVLHHWYQLTEHYSDDQRVDLYEVVITRHLDPEPAHHLALSEDDLPDLIARCTAGE
ncbi:hypothetical protein [Streptomyces sp. NPDC059783]|uniref:hypothetical protein n=1 Tax=Streptomyces sp. NPDC059783 TaxID=3346944 RepID=UPI00366A394B